MIKNIFSELDISPTEIGSFSGKWLTGDISHVQSVSPIDNQALGVVSTTSNENYDTVVKSSTEIFHRWRVIPAPIRGQIIREIANEFRLKKIALSRLITIEMGKIKSEGEGEVQEIIDIADFAAGLSRQLNGQTMHSERPAHRMYEQWHPLGNIGVISAFNFPASVWAWNAMIASVCGNTVIWKPSELTPLTSVAIIKLCDKICSTHGFSGLFSLVTGTGSEIGKKLAEDKRIPLISATGSCDMGRSVSQTVSKRLGKSLLELGGNNAVIVLKDADLNLAVRAILFGAIGTSGQRCTSTRRVLVESHIKDKLVSMLLSSYNQIQVGNPLDDGILMGPVINQKTVKLFEQALKKAEKEGGQILRGGKSIPDLPSANYVEPTIVLAHKAMSLIQEETFAPILYIVPVEDLDEALEIHNNVPQGLSSAIFSNHLPSIEKFLSCVGSDCGIANVNIGTSGAEIGGAFGGEKDTGGGREAGSDSWKAYMRRQTTTINWSSDLPLAQGVKFV
jgi:aldehyde dehydrogenase (NAD+)